jgi:hypothetical protein
VVSVVVVSAAGAAAGVAAVSVLAVAAGAAAGVPVVSAAVSVLVVAVSPEAGAAGVAAVDAVSVDAAVEPLPSSIFIICTWSDDTPKFDAIEFWNAGISLVAVAASIPHNEMLDSTTSSTSTLSSTTVPSACVTIFVTAL